MSLADRLRRIEQQQEEQGRKLDALIGALSAEVEEEQESPATSLDGHVLPAERDQSQSLG